MRIAITDANIFIDLIYVKLLEKLFKIGVEIHTTANVVDELNSDQQKSLLRFVRAKSLTVHFQEVFVLPEIIGKSKKLSESDKSVFNLALELDAFILTGDGVVRKVSGVQKIEVHGIIWLFDQFVSLELITKKKATLHLRNLKSYNKRLPQDECEKRFIEWGK